MEYIPIYYDLYWILVITESTLDILSYAIFNKGLNPFTGGKIAPLTKVLLTKLSTHMQKVEFKSISRTMH